MPHIGNGSDRSLKLERHREAERRRKEQAAEDDLRPVTLYAHHSRRRGRSTRSRRTMMASRKPLAWTEECDQRVGKR